MRCPKCGFITFDHLETCTKCRKNIADVSQRLSGTVYKAEAPSFLQFEVYDEGESDTEGATAVDLSPEEEDLDLEMAVDETDDVDVELSLEDETLEGDETEADEDLDLDFMDESAEALGLGSSEEEEFDLSLTDDESMGLDLAEEETGSAEAEDGPQLDFSELDISDLAPPAEEEADLVSAELTLDDVAETAPAADAARSPMKKASGAALEDLQMDGLDLEMPTLPPAGSVKEKKLRTTVKTGTALDNFDVDLGELISESEK